jgi:hypothetical protein
MKVAAEGEDIPSNQPAQQPNPTTKVSILFTRHYLYSW